MSPLSGIRVLVLSLQLPGPFCTLMMADHGTDVIKVDEPAPRFASLRRKGVIRGDTGGAAYGLQGAGETGRIEGGLLGRNPG